jgi:hypothetical protein
VKKSAVAALVLGVSSLLSVAQAAPVTVDASTYTLTYDDSFLTVAPGVTPSVTAVGDVVTFSGASVGVGAPLLGNPFVQVSYGIDSYNGRPFPIILTAKAGYKITSVSEALSGSYYGVVSPEAEGSAMAGTNLNSYWIGDDDVVLNNGGSNLFLNLTAPGTAQGTYTAGGTLALAPTQRARLSAIDFFMFATAAGSGMAQSSITRYNLNVQTAAVPEPETYALVLAGLMVAGVAVRRARQQG